MDETNSQQEAQEAQKTVRQIKQQITDNPILLYMKGTPQFPQCSFSARAIQILSECGQKFSYLNILEHPNIRSELPVYAKWPTFPQLYVDGELIGGSDIIAEMHSKGELRPLLEKVSAKKQTSSASQHKKESPGT